MLLGVHFFQLTSCQNLLGTFLIATPIRRRFSGSIEGDDQTWVLFLMPLLLLCLLCASIDSNSDASSLILRLSIPDADPPISAREPLSLCRYRLPGFFGQRPKDAPCLLLGVLRLMLGFAWLICNIRKPYMSSYLLRLN